MNEYTTHIRRVGKAQATVEQYEAVAKRIPDETGAIRLNELTDHDLDHLYGMLTHRLADSTIRTTHAVLHASVIRYCQASEDAARARAEVEKRGLLIDEVMAEPRGGTLGHRADLNPAEMALRPRIVDRWSDYSGCWADVYDDDHEEMQACEANPDPSSALGCVLSTPFPDSNI